MSIQKFAILMSAAFIFTGCQSASKKEADTSLETTLTPVQPEVPKVEPTTEKPKKP